MAHIDGDDIETNCENTFDAYKAIASCKTRDQLINCHHWIDRIHLISFESWCILGMIIDHRIEELGFKPLELEDYRVK